MPISPLHVLLYQTFFFSKNVQIRFFPGFADLCRYASFRSGFSCCSAATLSFFSFSGGLGNSPTSGIGYIVFIQCTPIPCLLLFRIFLTGKIHFSGAGTTIKWIEIENIFLYKFQVKKCPIFKHKKIRLWLIPEPDRWYSTKLLQFF